MPTLETLTAMYRAHHRHVFAEYGATPKGVDWGVDEADHAMRLDRMLAVVHGFEDSRPTPSVLDVGCGFGSLLDRATERGMAIALTGIDLVEEMIAIARQRHPDATWINGSVFDQPDSPQYDFVVNSGVLTQRLHASISEMETFSKAMIRKMYAMCRVGVAFNMMSSYVNFTSPNLFYKSPIELLTWIMEELSPKVRLDHAYRLFDYTVYVYRQDIPELTHKSMLRDSL